MTASWLSGFLAASLSPSPLQHTVQEAWRREDGAWVVGRREETRGGRRKCVCSVTVQPPAVQLCRRGNHFSCCETLPHVNLTLPHPLMCTFSPSFAHLDLSLSSLLHSQCHISFYPFIPFLPCDVGIPPLISQRQPHKNITVVIVLKAFTPGYNTVRCWLYGMCWENFLAVWVINRSLRCLTSLLLNDHRKAWIWRLLSEVKRISFSSLPLFLCLKGLSAINALWCTPHPFLAICPPPIFPQSPWVDLGPPLRSPCHRRKLPNCQHICDSLVSTPSKNMAVKIALSVLDHLESNLIQASRKRAK